MYKDHKQLKYCLYICIMKRLRHATGAKYTEVDKFLSVAQSKQNL